MNEVKKLVEKGQDNLNVFAPVGKKLFDAEKMIVTDIDHTLLGDEDALTEFVALIENMDLQ